MFADKLLSAIKEKNNPTVVGLDPKLDYIPEHILKLDDPIFEFNKAIIDATYDIVPCIKPQLAYYEMYGLEGLSAFVKTVNYAKSKGLLVIADAKRNDIAATSEAYSTAYLGDTFDCDALTVNGYLGTDCINPFLKNCKEKGKGIFVLVKTSNPSSGELQDKMLADGRSVCEAMADFVNEWGKEIIGESGYSAVGAVVGANYPEHAKALRQRMKNAIILVPAYGAQGGTAGDAAASFDENGSGAIVNASRSIMCAYKSKVRGDFSPERFAYASRAEAINMRDALNAAIPRNRV